jgi:hypothetical protein
MMLSPEDIELLKIAQESHRGWADHFERHPELEKLYLKTGEWDDAQTHRKFEKMYGRLLALLCEP